MLPSSRALPQRSPFAHYLGGRDEDSSPKLLSKGGKKVSQELRDVCAWGTGILSSDGKALAPALLALRDTLAWLKLRLLRSGLLDFILTASSVSAGVGLLYGVAHLAIAGWISMDKLLLGLSICCPGVTMVQFISPIPVVLEAVSKMSAANLPIQVFQSQAVCNILGISYGIQIRNGSVLVTNMFGLACQTMYLASEHYVRCSNTQWLWFSVSMVTIFNSGLYFFAQVASIKFLGHMITLFNVILFAAPLAKLGTILQTRNASSLPTAMIYISVLNNGVWTLFALLLDDMVLLLPSVLGYMLSAFQVMVILWCRGSLGWDLSFLLLSCRDCRESPKLVAEEDEEDPLGKQKKRPPDSKKRIVESELIQLSGSPSNTGMPALAG